MPKHEVKSSDIQALSVKHDLDLPMDIIVVEAAVHLKYHGDKTKDAEKLFAAGIGQYWDYDNNSDTKELDIKYDQQTGITRVRIVRV